MFDVRLCLPPMIPLLAQTTAPNMFVAWNVILTVILIGTFTINLLSYMGRNKAQQRVVSFSENFATAEQVRELTTRMDKADEYGKERRGEIYRKIEEARQDAQAADEKSRDQARTELTALGASIKEDISRVHKRIDQILEAVAELRGEMKGKNHGR